MNSEVEARKPIKQIYLSAQNALWLRLSREQLYRSFSQNGNPTLKTTLAVLNVSGLSLSFKHPS